jgi:DNA-binding transcriptional MerR regulator
MEQTPSMSIGQLAAATGLAAKTIRYYEEMGVLPASRRTAAGYRQYARRDVHRVLFIRRARALGFPLDKLRALTAELDGAPSRVLRPRLQQLVAEHLHALREQIADLRVLEQQLEQVLQRLCTRAPQRPSAACQCLGAATSVSESTPSRSPGRARRRGGGGNVNGNSTMEAITRLAATCTGACDCGCNCAGGGSVPAKQALLPLPRVSAPAQRDAGGRSRLHRTMDSRPFRR